MWGLSQLQQQQGSKTQQNESFIGVPDFRQHTECGSEHFFQLNSGQIPVKNTELNHILQLSSHFRNRCYVFSAIYRCWRTFSQASIWGRRVRRHFAYLLAADGELFNAAMFSRIACVVSIVTIIALWLFSDGIKAAVIAFAVSALTVPIFGYRCASVDFIGYVICQLTVDSAPNNVYVSFDDTCGSGLCAVKFMCFIKMTRMAVRWAFFCRGMYLIHQLLSTCGRG